MIHPSLLCIFLQVILVAEGRIPPKIDEISYISSSWSAYALYDLLAMDSSLDVDPICGYLKGTLEIPVANPLQLYCQPKTV